MSKEDVRRQVLETRIIAVVRASSPERAIETSCAIFAGGIRLIEMTMTVPCAVEVIAELRRTLEGATLGAGTVLDPETAQLCLEAGAQFIVSPCFDRDTVTLVNKEKILMLAGALTPTEVFQAWKNGSDLVKVFPCGNVGGPSYIKALKSIFPQIALIPTGGVNLGNAEAFLQAGASAVGVGGELTSAASIPEAARRYTAIARRA